MLISFAHLSHAMLKMDDSRKNHKPFFPFKEKDEAKTTDKSAKSDNSN